jgi:hypothetical protein
VGRQIGFIHSAQNSNKITVAASASGSPGVTLFFIQRIPLQIYLDGMLEKMTFLQGMRPYLM